MKKETKFERLMLFISSITSVVQTKNKIGMVRMGVAGALILIVMPAGVFGDDIVATPNSVSAAWGSNVAVNYKLVNTSITCGASSTNPVNVTINVPDGIKSNVPSFKFTSCNSNSPVVFVPTPAAVGTYGITVSTTGGSGTISTAQANVAINVTVPAITGKASAIITFDDGWVYPGDPTTGPFGGADMAQPILKANNQSGVAFIIEEPVVGGWSAYMTIPQIQSLYNDGWDISSHSLTHGSGYCTTPSSSNCILYLVNANDTVFKSEMGDSKDWLDGNGWTRSSMFFAYPYGSYNPSCFVGCDGSETGNFIDKMRASGYYIGARSVDGYSWRYTNPVHPNFYIGGPGALIMPTLSTDTQTSYPVADITSEIDGAIQESGTVILTFHQLVTGTPKNEEQYNINDFKAISNYLKIRNTTGNVQVVTLSQYFGVPNPIPTFVPNNATLQSITTGRTWMNISWTDGPGNMTNEYEVLANGIQNYYITNRSFNVTGLVPGQAVTAVIDAVNTSWGKHTKNLVPLTVTATIPIYTPPTPNISSTYGDSWVLTSWTPGDGNITDFYNINVVVRGVSTWYNGTTNTSINTTGLSPGQDALVKVYALNGTIGLATMNSVPAMIDTAVPGTNAPVIQNYTPDSANLSMIWTYKAGQNTDIVEMYINNGGVESNSTENLTTNNTGTFVLHDLAPRVTVDFGIRGKNLTTGLYSDYVYANQTLTNNPVILSNISSDYKVTQGQVLTIYPIANDADKDHITFNATKINETSIDTNTGVFYFDATKAQLGMYNINITADDGYGSSVTQKVSILVNGVPAPAPVRNSGGSGGSSGSSGGGGGGGSMGSIENYSNIAKFETEDGYIQLGKDTTVSFLNLPHGIYQVFLSGESQEVTVRVDNLKAHQNGVTDAPGKALLYTDVAINSERINGFSFSFKLNKSDITDPQNVKVYVWNNGTWKALDTNMTSASDTYVYFQTKAIPSKLSKFAISELVTPKPTLEQTADVSSNHTVKLATETNTNSSTGNKQNKAPGFESALVIGAISVVYIVARKRR